MGVAGGHRRRWRGPPMTTALMPQCTLTDDELQVIAARTGIDDSDSARGIRLRHGTIDALDAAFDSATRALAARRLIANGLVAPDLASLVAALHRPARELAMRIVTPNGITRLSMVRHGSLEVLARRTGDEFVLRTISNDGGQRAATQAMLAELPHMDPARIDPVGAPLDAMTEIPQRGR